jgi:ribosomal protein L29
MSSSVSPTELRKMTPADLFKEIGEKRTVIAKITMGVHMKTEKDTAKLGKARREMAMLQTILGELQKAERLKNKPKTSTVSASASTKSSC